MARAIILLDAMCAMLVYIALEILQVRHAHQLLLAKRITDARALKHLNAMECVSMARAPGKTSGSETLVWILLNADSETRVTQAFVLRPRATCPPMALHVTQFSFVVVVQPDGHALLLPDLEIALTPLPLHLPWSLMEPHAI